MSVTTGKAVFLSYAHEDAVVAQRIAEALHAGGVEVWFDQSEPRGGDAWDSKIKKQIRDCSLFVAVISAHTSARREGDTHLQRNARVRPESTVRRLAHFGDGLILQNTS